MSWPVTTLATVAIIALSAFFVAVEFSLINARRHRIEEAAATSASARAALRSSSEITLLLAGSQLGITVCTLALGAITKPAVHHALVPLLAATGLPATAADVAAFVLALVAVTFLHLVVGEMAPKSWAIAHPERSAIMLALPMRAFMTLTRPLLRGLNSAANALVRRAGVEPVDEVAQSQDEQALRQLVEHSADVGTLDDVYRGSLTSALDMTRTTLADLVVTRRRPTSVRPRATAGDVQQAVRASGHLRVLVMTGMGPRSRATGVVHVRDTLDVPITTPVSRVARPVLELDAQLALPEALARMRESRQQLAVVRRGADFAGVVTMADILPRLLPRTGSIP